MKTKLFYSYSHEDECLKNQLDKHLSALKRNGLICQWHDEKIYAGENWTDEIDKNITDADIILLLFSPAFIDSDACQKEVERALELKKEKGTIFIPIILKECAWKDINGISGIEVLPKKGKAIMQWADKDEGWKNVYDGIKNKIEKIRETMTPKLKDDFRRDLLHNPTQNSTLDKFFIYPDILENTANVKLENNEVDSYKLVNLNSFGYKYILIDGEEQIGKTSLCNMLYIQYFNADYYPILINGMDIIGKPDIKNIVNKACEKQYECKIDCWSIDRTKRILLIDDIEDREMNDERFSEFITSIKEHFDYAVIFSDNLSSLSDKTASHNYFSYFRNFSICSLGHKKRDELLKKCISYEEKTEFDIKNIEQVARLDKDTKHINTIIGTNVVPSYPVFIVTIFHTFEALTPQEASQTSYGHCYQAMITMSFRRSGIKPEHVDSYFNLLTELAYFMFRQKNKTVSKKDLDEFLKEYNNKFFIQKKSIETLIKSVIIKEKNGFYSFQYIYIYYYFVARYIARKIDDENVKIQIEELMKDIHLKDNANIIIFIAHHTPNKYLMEKITLNATSAFEKFPEVTLSGSEKNFIDTLSNHFKEKILPGPNHNVEDERNRKLEEKDRSDLTTIRDAENYEDQNDDLIIIEVRKSAKSIEIIGQILKNQSGSINKNILTELFEVGQNVGLRLLKAFMEYMENSRADLENFIRLVIEDATKEKNIRLSDKRIEKETKRIVNKLLYSVIFGWLHKIVDSLGYDQLIETADDVNDKTDSVVSKLINLYIHTWYTKKLNFEKISSIYRELKDDKNYQAIYILKDIVCRHIYMHPVSYKDKQKIGQLLSLSVKHQVAVQQKLEKK